MKISYIFLLTLPLLCRSHPLGLEKTITVEANDHGARGEIAISKRSDSASGSFDFVKHIKSGILKGVGRASAGLISKGSSSSSHSDAGPKSIDSSQHSNSVEYDPWTFKKSVLNTLFQAVKAITGGVTAIKGQLIKGSGYALSAGGQLIGSAGEKVTDVGKNIISSAQLVQPQSSYSHGTKYVSSSSSGGGHSSSAGPHGHSETITSYEIPEGHANYGPPPSNKGPVQFIPQGGGGGGGYSSGAQYNGYASFEGPPSGHYYHTKYGIPIQASSPSSSSKETDYHHIDITSQLSDKETKSGHSSPCKKNHHHENSDHENDHITSYAQTFDNDTILDYAPSFIHQTDHTHHHHHPHKIHSNSQLSEKDPRDVISNHETDHIYYSDHPHKIHSNSQDANLEVPPSHNHETDHIHYEHENKPPHDYDHYQTNYNKNVVASDHETDHIPYNHHPHDIHSQSFDKKPNSEFSSFHESDHKRYSNSKPPREDSFSESPVSYYKTDHILHSDRTHKTLNSGYSSFDEKNNKPYSNSQSFHVDSVAESPISYYKTDHVLHNDPTHKIPLNSQLNDPHSGHQFSSNSGHPFAASAETNSAHLHPDTDHVLYNQNFNKVRLSSQSFGQEWTQARNKEIDHISHGPQPYLHSSSLNKEIDSEHATSYHRGSDHDYSNQPKTHSSSEHFNTNSRPYSENIVSFSQESVPIYSVHSPSFDHQIIHHSNTGHENPNRETIHIHYNNYPHESFSGNSHPENAVSNYKPDHKIHYNKNIHSEHDVEFKQEGDAVHSGHISSSNGEIDQIKYNIEPNKVISEHEDPNYETHHIHYIDPSHDIHSQSFDSNTGHSYSSNSKNSPTHIHNHQIHSDSEHMPSSNNVNYSPCQYHNSDSHVYYDSENNYPQPKIHSQLFNNAAVSGHHAPTYNHQNHQLHYNQDQVQSFSQLFNNEDPIGHRTDLQTDTNYNSNVGHTGNYGQLNPRDAHSAAEALKEIIHLLPKTENKPKPVVEQYAIPTDPVPEFKIPIHVGPIESVSQTHSITTAYGTPSSYPQQNFPSQSNPNLISNDDNYRYYNPHPYDVYHSMSLKYNPKQQQQQQQQSPSKVGTILAALESKSHGKRSNPEQQKIGSIIAALESQPNSVPKPDPFYIGPLVASVQVKPNFLGPISKRQRYPIKRIRHEFKDSIGLQIKDPGLFNRQFMY